MEVGIVGCFAAYEVTCKLTATGISTIRMDRWIQSRVSDHVPELLMVSPKEKTRSGKSEDDGLRSTLKRSISLSKTNSEDQWLSWINQ